MFSKKRLVEVCPQCCQSVDSLAARLVQDSCGHPKCRICLLQEITGCLLCAARLKQKQTINETSNQPSESQGRKSVITSVAIQQAEEKQVDIRTISPPSSPSGDKDTCQIIKQSLEKEILFPTEIVKRSTGNFYHLKRIFSERFFNEEEKNKEHKSCETEKEWTESKKIEDEQAEKRDDTQPDNISGWRIPSHVEVRFFCTIHKVSFRQKHNILRNHMTCSVKNSKVILNSNGSVQCKICDKSYKAVGKLNRHMKTHSKVTKFKCETCDKYCADNYDLKTHRRSHTKEKPFVCMYCDKKFSAKQHHRRHEKKHRDERDFVCNDCGFKFTTRGELKSHSVTHTNIKAFTCNVCRKRFALKRTLIRHKKTHETNPAMLSCNFCDSIFRRKDNLERHIKNTHVLTKPV